MIIECLEVGHLGANCYVVGCEKTGEAAVIDPGGDADEIIGLINEKGLKVKYIVNTHGHLDHVAGNDPLRDATGAPVLIHELDADMLTSDRSSMFGLMGSTKSKPADRFLKDGEILEIGNIKLEVLYTPGHTRGGVCLAGEGSVFTGDTLFNASIGRTDFPGGDYADIINSIKTRLLSFPDDTEVYPGHMGSSTIGFERKYNPFLR